jgi:hypothetical protein
MNKNYGLAQLEGTHAVVSGLLFLPTSGDLQRVHSESRDGRGLRLRVWNFPKRLGKAAAIRPKCREIMQRTYEICIERGCIRGIKTTSSKRSKSPAEVSEADGF